MRRESAFGLVKWVEVVELKSWDQKAFVFEIWAEYLDFEEYPPFEQ